MVSLFFKMFYIFIYTSMSNCYIITYDIKNKDINSDTYQTLYNAIMSFPNWAHINESTRAVRWENLSAVFIRDQLMKFIPFGSSLFVIKSWYESAWNNVLCDNQWLINNL